MTDKDKLEKVRAEIERIWNKLKEEKLTFDNYATGSHSGKLELVCDLLSFIDSLQEEPVSDGLEIEIKHCIYEPFFDLDGVAVKGATKYLTVEDIADIARHFANWQKEQMMAKAIDAHCFGFQGAALFSFRLPVGNYLVGSEVKVFVMKED